MYAASVPLCGDVDDRVKHFIAGLAQAVKASRRPHYLYGTQDKMINGTPIGLPPLRNTFFNDYNPMTGSITKEADRMKIKELIEALQPYIDANKAAVGYVGERNAAGQMHGQGTYTFADGSVYVGEYRDNNRTGQGTYTYASGDVYVGEYRDASMHGQGTFTFADGDVYAGEWRDDIRNGQGTFTYANGDVYVGEFRDGYRTNGTHSYANGDVYVGEFKEGKRSGQGTLTYAVGRVEKGTFNDDKFTG